jgi:hypothetical protein
MSESQIPFLVELREEVRLMALTRTRAPRRLGRPPAGSLVAVAAVLASLAVVAVFLRVHPAPRRHPAPAASKLSLASALGPEAPGFSGVAPASARAALDEAARAAAAGTATPPLRAGEAWYSSSQGVTSYQLFSTPDQPRAAIETAPPFEDVKWFPVHGGERTAAVSLSPGSGSIGVSAGQGTPSAAPGFGDWDAMSTFTAIGSPDTVLRALARSWAGYLGYPKGNYSLPDLDASAFTILARAAAILGADPVSPRSRAAIFRALAALPHLGYLTDVRDPLGRRGVAVTETTTTIKAFGAIGGVQRYELELIFNPATGTVLGDRTIAATAIPALHVKAGMVLYSWAFRLTRVVLAGSVPQPRRVWVGVRERFAAEARKLDGPGRPCHRYAGTNGGLRTPPPAGSRCQQLIVKINQQFREALAHDSALLQAEREMVTPPPAVR